MLPPTSERLRDRNIIPYFAWDLRLTVGRIHDILAGGDQAERDEVLVRLLREANSRDVWLFLDWNDIEAAWERIEHRLGRARPVWRMLLEHHRAQT
jgi:hypothetical protein